MNDFEKKLREMSLARPSEGLDRRVGETLRAAAGKPQTERNPWHSWRVLAVAASGIAAALLITLLAARHRRPEAVVYRIEATGGLRQLLLEPSSAVPDQPHFTVNGSAR